MSLNGTPKSEQRFGGDTSQPGENVDRGPQLDRDLAEFASIAIRAATSAARGDAAVVSNIQAIRGASESQIPIDDRPEALIGRVRADYREMPGLCLTVRQACRRWHIDATTCARILDILVAERFLGVRSAGKFIAAP